MLRLFHTADWHLGQSFHGYDRDHEHAAFFEWLLGTLVERKPDALIVAGDVFDSVNPSAAAQRRLYAFLDRAHGALPSLQIILTAGNHDAAARLEAPSSLLERLRITIIGTVLRDASGAHDHARFLVPLRDAAGEVRALVLAVPFLRPCDVPELAECADPYLDGICELYRCVIEKAQTLRDEKYPGAALIALGHCHLHDCLESRDSERRLIVGGAEALRADAFPETLAYVALGHLHQPQELAGGRICYSGSPLPLSFSEKDYPHRILEVTVDEHGRALATPLPVPRAATLLRLPPEGSAPLPEVLRLLGEHPFDASLPPEAWPFLEVRVLDDGPDPTRARQIQQALAGKPVRLAVIRREPPTLAVGERAPEPEAFAAGDLADLDPEAILSAVFRERYAGDPDSALLSAFREILVSAEHEAAPGP